MPVDRIQALAALPAVERFEFSLDRPATLVEAIEAARALVEALEEMRETGIPAPDGREGA